MSSLLRVSIMAAVTVVVAAIGAPAATAGLDAVRDKGAAAAAIQPPALRPVPAAVGEQTLADPYLRAVLPESAYAYVRVPNIWRLLGAPTGGVLDKAYASKPYVAALAGIREGVAKHLIPELPADARALARLFLLHVRSPIEAVALPNEAAPADPLVLVSMQVDFPDQEALAGILAAAAAENADLTLVAAPTADTAGVLAIGNQSAQIQLDKARSRLFLLLAPTLAPGALDTAVASLQPNPAHPMLAAEPGIDASGQGLFVWVNPVKAKSVAAAAGKGQELIILDAFGFASVKSLALGVGTSDGIQRAKFAIEMPAIGVRTFLPTMRTSAEVKAAGTPDVVTVLGLPAPADLANIEATVGLVAPPEAMQAYVQGKAALAERLGFGVEDMLAVFGQDLVFVSDEAGQYLAVRIKDQAKFDALLAGAVERHGVRDEVREIAGQSYHHLVIPSSEAGAAAPGAEPEGASALERRFQAVPNHIYWTRDGEYVLLAQVPQVLIDRGYVVARTPVGHWLAEQQRMDPKGALLLISARTEGLPALMYRWNLEILSYLGDLAGRPVDLFAFPSPRELGLPAAGSYGFKITSSETELALELAFETNAAEGLFAGQGYGALAAIGIMAAIAIPAYQDYEVRSEVAAGFAAAAALREMVALSVAETGRFPDQAEVAELNPDALSAPGYRLSLNPDDGRIMLTFDIDELEEGSRIDLVPERHEGELVWECESEIANRYLPLECRD